MTMRKEIFTPEKKQQIYRLLLYGGAVIVGVWILAPIALIALAALSTPRDLYDIHKVLPTSFTLDHIYKLLFVLGAWQALINSILVALLTIGLSFLLGLPAGYALSRFIFPGRDTLKLLVLTTRMFPVMILAIPLTVLYIQLGLSDTLVGVALAHTSMVLPFVILITSSIFASVPVEYEEAAMIFGLSHAKAFLKVTLPLALPGLAASAIFTFIMSWNEVFVAAILTFTNRTLPAHILTTALASPDYFKFAAGLIMTIPAMIFVFIARKYLVTMWGITLR